LTQNVQNNFVLRRRIQRGSLILPQTLENGRRTFSSADFAGYSISARSFGSTQTPPCTMRFVLGCVLRINGFSRWLAGRRGWDAQATLRRSAASPDLRSLFLRLPATLIFDPVWPLEERKGRSQVPAFTRACQASRRQEPAPALRAPAGGRSTEVHNWGVVKGGILLEGARFFLPAFSPGEGHKFRRFSRLGMRWMPHNSWAQGPLPSVTRPFWCFCGTNGPPAFG
jgi:hypothetical protein